jgi:hypothetical protein
MKQERLIKITSKVGFYATFALFYWVFIFLAIETLPHNSHAQSHKITHTSQDASLELPSFSIFGLEQPMDAQNNKQSFGPTDLNRFLADLDKITANIRPGQEKSQYFIVPIVFYRIRHLFLKEEIWTDEEIEQGRRASKFFARLSNNPDLIIEASDQNSFRNGLAVLQNWFSALCRDNKTLAMMIPTFDDGPFEGVDVDVKDLSRMKLIGSAPFYGKQASFVLLTDESQQQPIIIGVQNEDKSIRWLKRFCNPPNRITRAVLDNHAIYRVKEYDYAVILMTTGSSGTEHSHVYLDEDLKLRFYFVSW